MKPILLIVAATFLFACSGKSDIPTRKTGDGLAYHPSPGTTGDGIPIGSEK